MNVTLSQGIFFTMIGVFYCFTHIVTGGYTCNLIPTSGKVVLGITSIMFAMCVFGYAYLAGILSPGEGWCLDPVKLCQGGEYMRRGNSAHAKACQKLARDHPNLTDRYKCPTGQSGQSTGAIFGGNGIEYSPLSDDNWRNSRCDGINNKTPGQGIF